MSNNTIGGHVQVSGYKKEILKAMGSLGVTYGLENAYRAWCESMALAIQNSCLHDAKWEDREERFRTVGEHFGGTDSFKKMFANLVEIFEADPYNDYLGQIYMDLFGLNKDKKNFRGQCFTSMSVTRCMAALVLKESDLSQYTRDNPLMLNDCAVGGGATTIAALGALHERGFDYQRNAVIHVNDIDECCVHMCFVQLSLLGARAIVSRMNTLSLENYETYYTPMQVLSMGGILY